MSEEPTRRQVLIVDDEPGMRYMARRVLENRFDVIEAESGEAAIEILKERLFHFAVVDVSLPGLSGLDLLTEMQTCCPDVDVIVMTGSASDPDETLEDSIRRKAYFFLRKPFPMTVLETLADRIVETQELAEQAARHTRALERTLESARVFQKQLLPETPWSGNRIEVASKYVPSERLSGDFIDYWSLPNGGTALFVADVMGHGPTAAMITGIVKSQVKTLLDTLDHPGAVLHALEQELSRLTIEGFLTAALLFDDPETERVLFSGAGHPEPFLLESGSKAPVPLESTGLPLNTGLPIVPRPSQVWQRTPGSCLFLYTDGYREPRTPDGIAFDDPDGSTETPFHHAVTACLGSATPPEGLEQMESALLDHLQGTEIDDDRAAIMARLS